MKVLIVEDSKEKENECVSVLRLFNAEWTTISNEKEAKELIKSVDFDLILLDMEMSLSSDSSDGKGNYSGLSILNTMKYNNIQTPVIVVTVYRNFKDMKTTGDPNDLLFLFNNSYFHTNNSLQIASNLDTRYLDGLHEYMCYRYNNYVGVVEYSVYNSVWKRRLQEIIKKTMEINKHENINY